MKFVGALVLLLAACVVGSASSCRVVRVVAADHHHVAPVIATYAAYPTYSVGYAPDLTEVVKALIEDNKAMREQLIQALRAGPGGLTLPLKAEVHPGLRVMQTRCASCHDETIAKAKGGGNVLFKGGEWLDVGDNLDRAASALEAGTMPKGGTLSAQEKFDVLRFLVLKPAAAKK